MVLGSARGVVAVPRPGSAKARAGLVLRMYAPLVLQKVVVLVIWVWQRESRWTHATVTSLAQNITASCTWRSARCQMDYGYYCSNESLVGTVLAWGHEPT
eukprot:1974355-Prymnesium_polylepis.1